MSDGDRYLGTYGLLRTAYSERFDEIASREGDTVDAYIVEMNRLADYIDSHKNGGGTWRQERAHRLATDAADDACLKIEGRLVGIQLELLRKSKTRNEMEYSVSRETKREEGELFHKISEALD